MTRDLAVGGILDPRGKLTRHAPLGAAEPVPDLRLGGADQISEGLLTPCQMDCTAKRFFVHVGNLYRLFGNVNRKLCCHNRLLILVISAP